MTYVSYLESCLAFAADTANWMGLNHWDYYTTSSIDGWCESCDNAHGGFGVSWAFHRTPEEIRNEAPGEYARVIVDEFRCALDNDCDRDTLYSVLSQFDD